MVRSWFMSRALTCSGARNNRAVFSEGSCPVLFLPVPLCIAMVNFLPHLISALLHSFLVLPSSLLLLSAKPLGRAEL